MAQCTAKSSRTGKPCKQQAIKGGTVCVTHGGAAPQVRTKAEGRLALQRLLDPAIRELTVIFNARNLSAETKLKAAIAVLDRNGLGPIQKIENITNERLTPEERLERLQALHKQLFGSERVQ